MADPLGLIGNVGQTGLRPGAIGAPPSQAPSGPGFKELLQEQIAQVNELQRDAKEAIEDLVVGRRDDIEGVMIATRKADTAFHLLLQVRNKMMEAYEEIKQLRI